MATRTLTGNRGASETRAEIKKHCTLEMRSSMKDATLDKAYKLGVWNSLAKVINFIDGMAPRANAKPGGLGRKWTAKKKR